MSTAGPPDAPTGRGEQPTAAAADEDEGSALRATADALRAEMAALRDELVSARDPGGAARESSVAALEEARGSLEARLAVLEDALDGLSERIEALARDGARTTTELLQSLGHTVRALPAALAARVEDLQAELGAALRAGQEQSARDRASVQELAQAVLATVDALGPAQADALGPRVDALAAATATTGTAVQDLRRDLDELGSGMISATSGLVQELRARSDREAEHVRAQLAAVRADFAARADELAGVLSRGLVELAEEVDVAATTSRDGSARVTALTEIFEVQRAEGERQLAALREDLLARTGSLTGELGARLDEVDARLLAVDTTVGDGAAAAERVAAALEDLTRTAERLDAAVAGFRAEWPTRTYEVVQGARAVAEGVVSEVREEVGARVDEVRGTLRDVLATLDAARGGLDDGTERLAQGAAVLVAYLEQRDRLLEAERDSVLHEVLDAFAAGLSARERSALAARVSDAVARRRDARDAERYRDALGEPVAPTADLPEEVRRLAERVPERPAVPRRQQQPAQPEPAPRQPAQPEPADTTLPPVTARPPVAHRTSEGTTVVPGPGRAAQGAARSARSTSRSVAASARGRLGAMPEAPSVDVALDAASSGQDDDRA